MKRRDFVKLGSLAAVTSLYPQKSDASAITFKKAFTQKLAIPPIAEYKEENGVKIYNLSVQEGKMDFLNGAKTSTYGINGDFLGPTIRVKDKDKIKINVANNLRETTTMHWHGLRIKGSSDGGPHNIINPNTTWSADIDIDQKASMCWYHPHAIGKTGRQVFMGLAGIFLIDDDETKGVDLPSEYGVDDIPLVLQDRRFDNLGEFLYSQNMMDTMMGVTGNVHLINGVIDPVVEVEPKAVRFRFLNGSNARIYNLMFEKQNEFFQVAGDSSLLPTPVKLSNFIIAPGERTEIVMDFSKYAGKTLYFGDGFDKRALLKIVVKNSKPHPMKLPEKLVTIDEYKDKKATNTRDFRLNMSMGFLGINEKQMDMNRIDERVKKDRFEIWRITNRSPRPHPFHVHGTGFSIISRDGSKPLINEMGLKDTVLVYSRETVEILVRFKYEADANTPYMYHCHILEHEDGGMMGQFTVEA